MVDVIDTIEMMDYMRAHLGSRTNAVSEIHDWRSARPSDWLKHDSTTINLKDRSCPQLAARVAGYDCSQTSVNEMQEFYKKTAYSIFGSVDEGNHTRSNYEHCGDRNPSGPPTPSSHGAAQKR
ncbi:unnamed protein product [Candida parapsilosis]